MKKALLTMFVVSLLISGCKYGVDAYTALVPPDSDVTQVTTIHSKPREVDVIVPDPADKAEIDRLSSVVSDRDAELAAIDEALLDKDREIARLKKALAEKPVEPEPKTEPSPTTPAPTTDIVSTRFDHFFPDGDGNMSTHWGSGRTIFMQVKEDKFRLCEVVGVGHMTYGGNRDKGRPLWWLNKPTDADNNTKVRCQSMAGDWYSFTMGDATKCGQGWCGY